MKQYTQFFERLFEILGAVKYRAVGQGQRMSYSHVHAYRWMSGFFHRLCGQFDLEQGIPPGRLAQYDHVFELAVGHFSVPTHLDQSDVLDVEPFPPHLCAIVPLVVHAVEPGRPLKSRFASIAFQELTVCAIQTAKHLLSSAHVKQAKLVIFWLFVAPVSPHACLFGLTNRLTALMTPFAPVVERTVVEPTGNPRDFVERVLLNPDWIQAIAVDTYRSADVLIVPKERDKRHSLSLVKPGSVLERSASRV